MEAHYTDSPQTREGMDSDATPAATATPIMECVIRVGTHLLQPYPIQ
jgi:hypothetical protein